MQLNELLKPELVYYDECSVGKTALFKEICKLLSSVNTTLCEEELFDAFIARERLGSTAIGHGIAIPHIRSDKVSHMQCCLIKLKHDIDFGAEDQQPINLVIAMIVPHLLIDEHLCTLSQIANYFNDEHARDTIKKACNPFKLQQAIFNEDYAISA